jgi:DNA-binding NarL/FixJ family response regulator
MARIKTPPERPRGGAATGTPSRDLNGINILVVDDHQLFREGLRFILEGLGQNVTVAEAESFGRVRQLAGKQKKFDLVIADLLLPGEDGFEGLKELRKNLPDAPVVVVSMLEDRNDVIRALDCGASGFIPKSSSSEVMLSALRLVFAGGVYLPPTLLADTVSEASRETGGSEYGRARATGIRSGLLTPRQLDVLAELGTGKSNREIARELGLAEGTVKVHVTAILKALGVKNRTQAVLAAGEINRPQAT